MACTPCQAAARRRAEARAANGPQKFTFPEGVTDPVTGKTTKVYRTLNEAKAAKIRYGGGTYEPVKAT